MRKATQPLVAGSLFLLAGLLSLLALILTNPGWGAHPASLLTGLTCFAAGAFR